MEINLSHDSIVDQRTGQVDTPSEFLQNLQSIETEILRVDDEIVRIGNELKNARKRREGLVARLRSGVREGKVLPLFEAHDDDTDGLEAPAPEAPDADGLDLPPQA